MFKATVTAIVVCLGSSASAGSFDPAVMDPVVTPPAQCRILGILPCHTGFKYINPEGDNDVVPVGTVGNTDDDPYCSDDEPKNEGKSKDKGSKGNASANNGKGGNYDKTGHSDNGKGQGRNKK